MRHISKILLLGIFICMANSSIFAEEMKSDGVRYPVAEQRVSFGFEFFNNSLNYGINAEYSPNQYFDFGLGYTPWLLFVIPARELHVYARACFFDFPVQPYVQLSASLGIPSMMEEGAGIFNARCGAGVKFTFGKYIYCGFGGAYSFIGQDFLPSNWKGFCPAAFIGCTAFRF